MKPRTIPNLFPEVSFASAGGEWAILMRNGDRISVEARDASDVRASICHKYRA
jgi:hypothetical protein